MTPPPPPISGGQAHLPEQKQDFQTPPPPPPGSPNNTAGAVLQLPPPPTRPHIRPSKEAKSSGAFVAILLTLIVLGIASSAWILKEGDTVRFKVYPWLYRPSEALLHADVIEQLSQALPEAPNATVELVGVALMHRRGDRTGAWTGIARIALTEARYDRTDWMEEAMNAGLDKEAFASAKKACSSLPGKDAPKKPFVLERVLVRKVAAANSSADIPLRGQLSLQDDVWTTTTGDLEGVETAIQNFLKGSSLSALGEDALVLGSSEAIGALESLVSEGKRFISNVQTAQKRLAELEQAEQLQAAHQNVTGLVQAAWYALERLSKYLSNIDTHRRLIEIAVARGDSAKAELYRSYSKANDQNIEESASSYIQAIRDLEKVSPDLRKQALEALKSQIAVFSIPWKTALLGRLITDIEAPPKYGTGKWMEDIRRLRQQHQQ